MSSWPPSTAVPNFAAYKNPEKRENCDFCNTLDYLGACYTYDSLFGQVQVNYIKPTFLCPTCWAELFESSYSARPLRPQEEFKVIYHASNRL